MNRSTSATTAYTGTETTKNSNTGRWTSRQGLATTTGTPNARLCLLATDGQTGTVQPTTTFTKKNNAMITKREFQQMKGAVCPYGRKTNVGDVRCTNCKFHHIMNEYCSGEPDTVREHMKHINLGY